MNTDIYHKISKYQQKLERDPNNSIYQYKLKYYYQMIGGGNKMIVTYNIDNIHDKKISEVEIQRTGFNPLNFKNNNCVKTPFGESIYRINFLKDSHGKDIFKKTLLNSNNRSIPITNDLIELRDAGMVVDCPQRVRDNRGYPVPRS